MVMKVAGKGVRLSTVKARIPGKAKTINFSSGFMREFGLSPDTAKFIRLGFDAASGLIGLVFLAKQDNLGQALKLTYSANSGSASCPIRPILTVFGVDVGTIAGVYVESAITANAKIEGFAEKGFLLHPEEKY